MRARRRCESRRDAVARQRRRSFDRPLDHHRRRCRRDGSAAKRSRGCRLTAANSRRRHFSAPPCAWTRSPTSGYVAQQVSSALEQHSNSRTTPGGRCGTPRHRGVEPARPRCLTHSTTQPQRSRSQPSDSRIPEQRSLAKSLPIAVAGKVHPQPSCGLLRERTDFRASRSKSIEPGGCVSQVSRPTRQQNLRCSGDPPAKLALFGN